MRDRQEKMISDEIKKLVPVLGKEQAMRLNKAYLLGDEEVRDRIFELVDVIKAGLFADDDLRDSVLMEPPPKEIAIEGDLELGHVLYGKKDMYPIKIKKEDLLTHIGVFGSSGYGKTNISYTLIKQIHELGIPVLIFDFSKRNYKDLLSTNLRDSIDIYTIGRDIAPFKFNPLAPPKGISMSQWMKEFASIFDHAYWLLGGGKHIILKSLDGVHKEKKHPTLHDLKSWMSEYGEEKLPTRERNWLATAERPLESLCFREIGDIFKTIEGQKPSDFFKKGRITILELDALDTNDKTFFIEILLQWIRDWMLVNEEREQLKGVIILEEAHHVLNREKSSKLGTETVIELVFREIRELGLGMIYMDQHPSMISYPAIGNTSTHIYMNLGLDTKHTSDVQDAGNMLGLDRDEQGHYLRRLPVGHGFMLLRTSTFSEPFLVRFNKFDMIKGSVSDDDIREVMKDKILHDDTAEMPPAEEKEFVKSLPVDELDDSELGMIKTIGNGTAAYTSQIYTSVKMSGATFKKKAERLLYLGLVDSKDAKMKKNRLTYYFLTNLGEHLFEEKFAAEIIKTPMNIESIVETFNEVGWKSEAEGNKLFLHNEDKELLIMLEDDMDRKRIYEDIKQSNHFICSNDKIRNIVLQQSAKYAKTAGKKVVVFIATLKKFEDKGTFDKVEF